jgi:hypothetical protein
MDTFYPNTSDISCTRNEVVDWINERIEDGTIEDVEPVTAEQLSDKLMQIITNNWFTAMIESFDLDTEGAYEAHEEILKQAALYINGKTHLTNVDYYDTVPELEIKDEPNA